jgi:ribosome-associated protein
VKRRPRTAGGSGPIKGRAHATRAAVAGKRALTNKSAAHTNNIVPLRRQGIATTREQVSQLTDRQTNDLAQRCRESAIEKKADNVLLLDIRGRANFADYFVLATGRSAIHVRAIADGVVEGSETKFGAPIRTEGYNDGNWILVDYGPVIVHVFSPGARDFYNLERLWAKPTRAQKRKM